MLVSINAALTYIALAIVAYVVVRRIRLPRPTTLLSESPPRANDLQIEAVLLAVLVYLTAGALLAMIMGNPERSAETVGPALVADTGTRVVGILACLLIARRGFDGGATAFLLGRRRAAGEESEFGRPTGIVQALWIVAALIVALGLCPLIAAATVRITHYFFPTFSFEEHSTIAALQDGSHSAIVVAALWIGAALVAPVAEECFFRGLLQTVLLNATKRRWMAILVTSIAFAAVHLPQYQAVPALLFLSVLIGLVYERTGSLLGPIAVHAAFNLKTLVWDALGYVGV